MSGMNEDVFKIQLEIHGKYYPYVCKRIDEGKIRKVARSFTKLCMDYRNHYEKSGMQDQDAVVLAGFQCALRLAEQENREDISPVFRTVEHLNRRMEEYLQSVSLTN
jgi:hypothetical protein